MKTLGVLATTIAGIAAGCGGGATVTGPSGHDVESELRHVRSGVPHDVYFAGRRVGGLPLTAVYQQSHRPGHVDFMYGTCTIELAVDGGCGVPVEIQNFPFDRVEWGRSVGCTGRTTVRGVPAVRIEDLLLFTRDTIVKVHAPSRAVERHVVAALRPLDGRVVQGPLPAPAAEQIQLVEDVCLATPRGGLRRP